MYKLRVSQDATARSQDVMQAWSMPLQQDCNDSNASQQLLSIEHHRHQSACFCCGSVSDSVHLLHQIIHKSSCWVLFVCKSVCLSVRKQDLVHMQV